jgi:anaerobic magnesium-protoporphyrin IX monomethyl ester cyclase
MTKVVLIYPFFKPRRDRSVFRFPPLGISYIAAALRAAGHEVLLLDCTFLSRDEALRRTLTFGAEVAGIYCMVTMKEDAQWFAVQLRARCRLLVAGGPLPSCDPAPFLDRFDVAVIGEGEHTMVDLMSVFEQGRDLGDVQGIAFRKGGAGAIEKGEVVYTKVRPFAKDIDALPFPARDLLSNEEYIRAGKKRHGFSISTIMSTRGCPYRCEFCSNVIFGGSYRERSVHSVADEIEEVLALGYDRISFADDVFTMKKERVIALCDEIRRRGLRFEWECLGRVDSLDYATALTMKEAGCNRVFFGIESGHDKILALMGKGITTAQARSAVEAAHRAGLQTGAFFILFYPGDTNDTVIATLRFAASLPLNYLGLTMPYPLPGTPLYARVKEQIRREWRPAEVVFGSHKLLFKTDFSAIKMHFGILKGQAQFALKKKFGKLAPPLLAAFEPLTDLILRLLP